MRWTLPHGVQVAFSGRVDGDLHDPDRRGAFLAGLGLADCARLRQVHGTRIVDAPAAGWLGDGDGLVGSGAVPLLVYGADCPGVIVAAPDVLGAAHCGWRGAAGGLAARLVSAVARHSLHGPADFAALVGPGIGGPMYEVDGPVLGARSWPPGSLSPSPRADRAHLDLATALAADLRGAGVGAVRVAGICTASSQHLWSYRRDGAGMVQGLVAWRAVSAD